MTKYLTLLAGAIIALIFTAPVQAAVVDKDNICHHTESDTHPWVAQQVNANELQSHLDNGDTLYTGPVDNKGKPDKELADDWCVEHVPQPTVTPTPTIIVYPSINPCDLQIAEVVCPTPTPTPTPTATPTPTNIDLPTPTPAASISFAVSITPTPTPTIAEELPATGSNATIFGLIGLGISGAGVLLRKVRS